LPIFSHSATLNCQIPGLLATYPPKIVENQSFIFDVKTGYLPKTGRNLAGECPELPAAKLVQYLQKPVKINILYPGVTLGSPYCWQERGHGRRLRV